VCSERCVADVEVLEALVVVDVESSAMEVDV
jgi:hypothetical protein